MTPEQWAQVNALFHDVLDRAPDERARFLRQATPDEHIRAEVEALVAAHARNLQFLESPAVVEGARRASAAAAEMPTALESVAPRIGRTIGPYRVTRELARGGMGVVYLAHDLRLGRDVAIKALPHDLAADPARRERLRREARAAAALAHPGIATVFALEEDGDELFLVSEYIAGGTLRDLIHEGPLAADRLLRVCLDLADATAAAHAHGIVHRDLKPENVIYAGSGSIKILDFGLARALPEMLGVAPGPRLTAEGMLVGTPAYMAPEQVRGGAVDQRTDVFALGIVFYELATARHPFGIGAVGETLHQLLTADPAPIDRSDLPVAFEAIVRRCLEKDPERRYADASELAASLAPLLSERGARAGSGARTAPPDAIAVASSATSGPRVGPNVGDAVTTAAPARTRGTAAWWWAFHQAAVSAFCAAIVAPVWMSWGLIGDARLRSLLRVVLLVVVAAAVSVRLHLRFVARVHPASLAAQRARVASWLAACDWGLTTVLGAGGLVVMEARPLIGGVFVGLAVCYAVVFLQVEPATARAAFDEPGDVARGRDPSG